MKAAERVSVADFGRLIAGNQEGGKVIRAANIKTGMRPIITAPIFHNAYIRIDADVACGVDGVDKVAGETGEAIQMAFGRVISDAALR